MASAVAACRLSARLANRNVKRKAGQRNFSCSSQYWAAQNFVMPSMSPTMTEGNIAIWKVKEGDSFSAGDVLLEIETDKAQMEVEAQEDGIMAKITQQDGAKAVKVGARIAVLAEPGDDIKSLEIPEEVSSSSKPSPERSSPPKPPAKPRSEIDASRTSDVENSTSKSSSQPHTKSLPQKYPLYPSVQFLLHGKGLTEKDAIKIIASGPNGRLLKGDVLAYLGRIEKAYPSDQSKRIAQLGHLDLSNIKKAQPKRATRRTDQAPEGRPTVELDLGSQIAVPISLDAVLATQKRIQQSLGISLPLSTFIARASELANENLPRSRSTQPTSAELFDAVLGLDTVKKTSKGRYTPHITTSPPTGALPSSMTFLKKMDIFEILIGTAKPFSTRNIPVPQPPGAAAGANNVFSVIAKKGDERRAKVYLERVKTVLETEPGRCVL